MTRLGPRKGRAALAILAASAAALSLAPSAGAAFPGHNGRIAFDRYSPNHPADADIVTVKPDGSDPVKLTRHSPANDDVQPAYSRDGKQITWSRDSDVWLMDADGSGKQRLTHTGADLGPAFSPSGRKIIWTHVVGQHVYLKVMKTDGSGKHLVGVEGLNAAYSPDGQWIAYDRGNNSSKDIYTVHRDGAGELNLTSTQDDEVRHPDWSPDGQTIVYQRYVSGSEFDIFTMDPGGGNAVPIVQGTVSQQYPVVSPNGARIAFENQASDTDYDLWTAELGPSTPVQITSSPTAYDEFPSWQPR